MKQFKKLIACVLAATLVLGSTTVFFGAEETTNPATGTITGGAQIEDVVNREVFSVLVPTDSVTANAYDFTLDPEGLIETTSGKAYSTDGSIKFNHYGSMYFKVSDTAYDTSSQKATLTNMSSVDVTVSLNATVTVPASNSAVKFVSDDTFESTDLEIYLAIEGEDETGATVTGSAISTVSGTSYTTSVETELASYNAYTIQVTNGKYVYAIDDTVADDVTAASYTFWLTGACNENADWSTYVEDEAAQPEITLVWTVDIKEEAEVVEDAAPTFTTGEAVGTINYTKGSGDLALASITSIMMTNAYDTFDIYNANDVIPYDGATDNGSVITFAQNSMQYYTNATYVATITYVNEAGDTKTATVTVKGTGSN